MILIRLNPIGMKFNLEDSKRHETTVTRVATATKAEASMVFPISLERMSAAWYKWQMQGQFVQVAFPDLTAEQRKFIMSGITPEEWKQIFGEVDE